MEEIALPKTALKLEDLKKGRYYINRKNREKYVLTGFGFGSENNEYMVHYQDAHGNPWDRPIGLFMLKFVAVAEPKKEVPEADTYPALITVKKRKKDIPTVVEINAQDYILRPRDTYKKRKEAINGLKPD